MSETTALEKIFGSSVGGPCDFPEPQNLSIPIDIRGTRIRKRVRGGLKEKVRFKDDLQAMVNMGQLTQEQANEWSVFG